MSDIDWEQMDMIADGYSAEFLEILNEFASEMPALLANLQTACATGECDEVIKVAHQIKGSAANFGFRSVSTAAAEIESRAKAGSLDGCVEQLALAQTAFSASLDELRASRGVSVS